MPHEKLSLAELLSHKFSHEYLVKSNGLVHVLLETFKGPQKLEKMLKEEQNRTQKLRKILAMTLSPLEKEQAPKARELINFLKLRMSRLDFWSGFFTAVIAISGIALALQRLLEGVEKSWVVSLVLLVMIFLFVWLKWRLEKQKYWYGYLVTLAESIEFQLRNAGKGCS